MKTLLSYIGALIAIVGTLVIWTAVIGGFPLIPVIGYSRTITALTGMMAIGFGAWLSISSDKKSK
jgi:hypothetical protein